MRFLLPPRPFKLPLLLLLFFSPLTLSVPTPLLPRRGDVHCFLAPPRVPFVPTDCFTAINSMTEWISPSERGQLQVFGPSGDDASAFVPSLPGRVWTFGTCEVSLVAYMNRNQLATWNIIRTAALRIAQQCVRGVPTSPGYSFVDRRPSDPLYPATSSLRVMLYPVLIDAVAQLNVAVQQDPAAQQNETCAAGHEGASESSGTLDCQLRGALSGALDGGT